MVSLFSPVLKEMKANMDANKRDQWGEMNRDDRYLKSSQSLDKLKAIFASFEAPVREVEVNIFADGRH